jgi:hypothetical protein
MRLHFAGTQQRNLELLLADVDAKNVHCASSTPVCISATLTHAGSSTLRRVLRYRSAFKAKRPGRRSLLRARGPSFESARTSRALNARRPEVLNIQEGLDLLNISVLNRPSVADAKKLEISTEHVNGFAQA